MPSQLPRRPNKYELPSVISAAQNAASFHGVAPPFPPESPIARAGFQPGGVGLAEAHGVMEWEIGEGIGFIVGHYNPAKNEWQIFSECIPNQRHANALAAEMQHKLPKFRREALAEGRRPGGGFVDYHAADTQTARQHLEQLTAPLNPMDFTRSDTVAALLDYDDELHDQKGSSVVAFDEGTFCFPTLGVQSLRHDRIEPVGAGDSITTTELELRADAVLTLCYAGLIVRHPEGQGHMRAIRHVPVAHGDPELGWIANADAVSPDQWDILQPIPSTLIEMAHDIPRFSPLYCSVTYGQPGAESLQVRPID